MAKPVLGKSVRFYWFLLGRDFAERTVCMETIQAVYYCFGALSRQIQNLQPKQRKKIVIIVILHVETTRKS